MPDVVVIASSTGGPEAVEQLLTALPAGFDVPILIAQHMPPMFTTMFASRLGKVTGRPVLEAENAAKVQRGHVYIAPGDHHLEVHSVMGKPSLHVHQGPKLGGCRPAASLLIRSAAETFGTGATAVVLTGMGDDGLVGCQALHSAGGEVIAQDADSATVWGMPGSVVKANLADQVMSPSRIAHYLAGGRP